MKEFCSTREVSGAVGIPQATLSRFAVEIDLRAGSKKQGSGRKLDFSSALAFVLFVRCRQIAKFPYESRFLFNSIREKIIELGKAALDYAILVHEDRECITIGKRSDVKNIRYPQGDTFLTGLGEWYTVLSIRPFYEKLDYLMNDGPAPQPDFPAEGLKKIGTIGTPLLLGLKTDAEIIKVIDDEKAQKRLNSD